MFRNLLVLFALSMGLGSAAEDVVHLLPRGAVKGKISSIDAKSVRIRVSLAGGKGSSSQTIPIGRVKLIDFAPLPGEAEIMAEGAVVTKAALTNLWAKKRPQLARPNSNAGEVGLRLGEVLLASDDAVDHKNALNLYSIIEGGDWDPKRRAQSTRGRLEALVKTGAAAEVLAEATKIATEGGDPALLLDAEYVLASADLTRLRELVADNPKWREDDHVGPEIEALYHDLLDRFLKPFLFYGTESEAATNGLLAAGEVYYLIDQPDRARECFDDIQILYPKTKAHIEAAAFLKRISSDNDEKEPNPKK